MGVKSTQPIELLWVSTLMTDVKRLAQYLAHSHTAEIFISSFLVEKLPKEIIASEEQKEKWLETIEQSPRNV